MATLRLQEKEMLAEKVKGFPILFDPRVKGLKEKDTAQKAWEKVAESLDFAEMVILAEQVSTKNILKIAVLKKNQPCSLSEILTQY